MRINWYCHQSLRGLRSKMLISSSKTLHWCLMCSFNNSHRSCQHVHLWPLKHVLDYFIVLAVLNGVISSAGSWHAALIWVASFHIAVPLPWSQSGQACAAVWCCSVKLQGRQISPDQLLSQSERVNHHFKMQVKGKWRSTTHSPALNVHNMKILIM